MEDNKEIALNLRLKERERLWKEIQSFPKRKVIKEQLTKDLEELEEE